MEVFLQWKWVIFLLLCTIMVARLTTLPLTSFTLPEEQIKQDWATLEYIDIAPDLLATVSGGGMCEKTVVFKTGQVQLVRKDSTVNWTDSNLVCIQAGSVVGAASQTGSLVRALDFDTFKVWLDKISPKISYPIADRKEVILSIPSNQRRE